MVRFAGFELDEQRAELRGPDGALVRLRPKTFEMLCLFAANAGRVLSKPELMEAVWPNIHVGEDGLFQCVREIRAALGDEQRQMIKLVSGRGYLFVPAYRSSRLSRCRLQGQDHAHPNPCRGAPVLVYVGRSLSRRLPAPARSSDWSSRPLPSGPT